MSAERLAERFPAVFGSQRANAPSTSVALGRSKMRDMTWATARELERARSGDVARGSSLGEKMWGAMVSRDADGGATLALVEAWFDVRLRCTDHGCLIDET